VTVAVGAVVVEVAVAEMTCVAVALVSTVALVVGSVVAATLMVGFGGVVAVGAGVVPNSPALYEIPAAATPARSTNAAMSGTLLFFSTGGGIDTGLRSAAFGGTEATFFGASATCAGLVRTSAIGTRLGSSSG
jgi:hypothetical protein